MERTKKGSTKEESTLKEGKREMQRDKNGNERDDTKYIKVRIKVIENHLRRQYGEIPMVLIRSGLEAVQQWSRKLSEDGTETN